MTNAVINTDLKKYTKKYIVEDSILWEVFDDNISKAEVIWDMENIADLFNKLHDENEQLKQTINVQNGCIQELEDWFKKYGYDNVNFEVLDNIMESYLND